MVSSTALDVIILWSLATVVCSSGLPPGTPGGRWETVLFSRLPSLSFAPVFHLRYFRSLPPPRLAGKPSSQKIKMAAKPKQVQTFGRKRHAVAVAVCSEGKGLIRVNGHPLHLLEPQVLRVKLMEPGECSHPEEQTFRWAVSAVSFISLFFPSFLQS